ncbi:MAG: hypothetical protein R2807_07165 [Chitinophagales bacterium]
MSKKQPQKPLTSIPKKSTVTTSKNNSDSSFQISNKIVIPILLLIFIALAYFYCKPLMDGMQLSTHDSNQYIK